MKKKEYQNFEDFILDESFHEFVAGSDEASVTFWNNWITNHTEKTEEFQKAIIILGTLQNTLQNEIVVDKDQLLHELMGTIEADKKATEKHSFTLPSWVKIAAVLVLSVGFGWLWNYGYIFFKAEDAVAYNEIIVPIGEKSQIILSDGTHVWINSGSRFKYPEHFGENSRDVFLVGEAFFDVTKQNKKLFVVNTQDARVEVLGTAFNVKAYPEDSKTQTTVARGLVSVQSTRYKGEAILIKPQQMAEIRKAVTPEQIQSGSTIPELQVKECKNVEAITSWKDQLLVFNDEPFEDIALKMERWFNVKIIIKDASLKKERFNGKFVHNETVYQVLEVIMLTTPIKYKAIDNQIYISLK
jgi:ferric-dicitrate binding protein FerR (iron transport regulator)